MFYDRFKHLCDINGTTPTAVLKQLNISTSKGTAWKTGSEPTAKYVILISEFFDVSTDYLLGRTDEPSGIQQTNTITGNNNTHNTMTCKTVTQPQLDETTGELVTVFKSLKFGDKVKVMSLVAELSEKKGA
jgi:hypothetical protein